MVDVVWCWESPWRHPLVQPSSLTDEETDLEERRGLHSHLPINLRDTSPPSCSGFHCLQLGLCEQGSVLP